MGFFCGIVCDHCGKKIKIHGVNRRAITAVAKSRGWEVKIDRVRCAECRKRQEMIVK